MNKSTSWIKTVYLYLFSLLGLVLIIIGTVNFLDMAFKAYVFTSAEKDREIRTHRPTPPNQISVDSIEKIKESPDLTQEQQQDIESWLQDYTDWKHRQQEFDPVTSDRHEQASKNLAMIIVGLPVFLYHWRIIRRDNS